MPKPPNLTDRAFSLTGSELRMFLRALPSDVLADLWEGLSPGQCNLLWERARDARGAGRSAIGGMILGAASINLPGKSPWFGATEGDNV